MFYPLRFGTALSAVTLGALASVALLAGTATAAPYTEDPTVTIGDSTPDRGGWVWGTLSGFAPLETIDVELHSKPVDLGTAVADSIGSADYRLQLPRQVCGTHEVVATGMSSGRVAAGTVAITCDNGNGKGHGKGSNNGKGHDALSGAAGGGRGNVAGVSSMVGASVAGLGGAGLLGGGLLLMRRRRSG